MKVSIVTITSSEDGNVEVTTKPFSTFEKATKYLMKQYIEIKGDCEDITLNHINKLDEENCVDFFMEDESVNWWCSGVIYTMDVE